MNQGASDYFSACEISTLALKITQLVQGYFENLNPITSCPSFFNRNPAFVIACTLDFLNPNIKLKQSGEKITTH